MERVPAVSPLSTPMQPPDSANDSSLAVSEDEQDGNLSTAPENGGSEDENDSKYDSKKPVIQPPTEFWEEGQLHIVGIYIGCEKLNHIDVVTQSFACSFKVGMLWHASKKDLENFRADELSYIPSWVPRFEVPNTLSIETKEMEANEQHPTGFRVLKEGDIDNWGMTVTNLRVPWLNECTWTIEGSFSEEFEIQRFPMDVQDLQISIYSRQPLDQCIYMPSLSRDEVIADLDLKYGDHDEYDFFEPLIEYDQVQWDEDGYGMYSLYVSSL